MALDEKAFLKAKFSVRTEDVPVPELRHWFADGEKAVIPVRVLGAQELARAIEASDRQTSKLRSDLAEAIARGSTKGGEIAEALGFGDKTPPGFIRQKDQILLATDLGEEVIVKIAENYPAVFLRLAMAVNKMVEKGNEAALKPRPSGSEKTSAP